MGAFQNAKKQRICIDCNKKYTAISPPQIRCGSIKEKLGCCYKHRLKTKAAQQKKRMKKVRYERRVERFKQEARVLGYTIFYV